jgi:alpha-glucosidase
MRRIALGLVCLAASAACGDDTTALEPTLYELSDGTKIEVAADGALSLSTSSGSATVTLLPAAELATFDLYASELFASYAFTRESEVRTRFDRLVRSEAFDGGVRVVYGASDGAELTLTLEPLRPGEATRITVTGTTAYDALSVALGCDADSSFFGFGEQYDTTDQRGEAFSLFVSEQGIGRTAPPNTPGILGSRHTTYYPMPYFADARGFGLLAKSYARVLVDLCKTEPDVARLEVESNAPVELVLFHGPSAFDVVRQLGDEIGRPTRPPSWALEPWMAAQGGREVVLAEVDALVAADIPFSALWVQDWTGIRPNVGGGFGVEYRWEEDAELYPDLAEMVASLRERGIKFLAYANPFVDDQLPNHFAEMAEADLLVRDAAGEPYVFASPSSSSAHPDLLVPEARAYVNAALTRMVEELGFDGWMADFAEWTPIDAAPSDGSSPFEFHNRFPELWHAVSREVMEASRPDGDWVVFSRSGHIGDPSVAQVVWCGDQEADFSPTDGLPTVVPAMLNLGISGLPFVTHDIAGFSGGPSTKEVFQRWTELGAFSPIMRTHDGNAKLDNWRWSRDAETTEHFRRFARIHVALGPELEQLFDEAAETGKPIVRHLAFVFPSDPALRAVDDQFLLGDDLLVAPVLVEGATSRAVVLPSGATWYDVWTGEAYEGGATVEHPAPIGAPPVFARAADRSDLRAIE